jgi:hypothetical protein
MFALQRQAAPPVPSLCPPSPCLYLAYQLATAAAGWGKQASTPSPRRCGCPTAAPASCRCGRDRPCHCEPSTRQYLIAHAPCLAGTRRPLLRVTCTAWFRGSPPGAGSSSLAAARQARPPPACALLLPPSYHRQLNTQCMAQIVNSPSFSKSFLRKTGGASTAPA